MQLPHSHRILILIIVLWCVGACEGSLACTTCHVILAQELYDKLPAATDQENDLLDMAFGLTPTYD